MVIADKDFSGITKVREEQVKTLKKVCDDLSEEQKTRLNQIEAKGDLQGQEPATFANAHAQKTLKLTSEQKEKVKEAVDQLDKDFKESTTTPRASARSCFRPSQEEAEKNTRRTTDHQVHLRRRPEEGHREVQRATSSS